MIGLLLAAALLLQPAAPAPAGDWQRVSDTATGEVFVDRAMLERDGDLRTLRTRALRAEASPDGVRSVVARTRIDCRRRTWAPLHSATYRTDGSVIMEATVPAAEQVAQSLPDDPITRAILAVICRP